jgi:hypothetical protein
LIKSWGYDYHFNKKSIQDIAYGYKICESNFFTIPLTLFTRKSGWASELGYRDESTHRNVLLINKAKGTVIRLEPQYEQAYFNGMSGFRSIADKAFSNQKIIEGITHLVNEIGLKEPTFIDLDITCPQYHAQDTNCVFWSLLMLKSILENPYKDPNELIETLTKSRTIYDDIEDFKLQLVTEIIPKALDAMGQEWPEFQELKQKAEQPVPVSIPLTRVDSVSKPGGKRKTRVKKQRKNKTKRRNRKVFRN